MTTLSTFQALISTHREPQNWNYDFKAMDRHAAMGKLPEALTQPRIATMKGDEAVRMRWTTNAEPLRPGPEVAETSASTLKREFTHRAPFAPAVPIYLTKVEIFYGDFTLEAIDIFYREGVYFPRPEMDAEHQEFVHDYHVAIASVIDKMSFGEPEANAVNAKLEFLSPVHHVRTAMGDKQPWSGKA